VRDRPALLLTCERDVGDEVRGGDRSVTSRDAAGRTYRLHTITTTRCVGSLRQYLTCVTHERECVCVSRSTQLVPAGVPLAYDATRVSELARACELVVTGPALRAALASDARTAHVMQHVHVFARMTPADKEMCVCWHERVDEVRVMQAVAVAACRRCLHDDVSAMRAACETCVTACARAGAVTAPTTSARSNRRTSALRCCRALARRCVCDLVLVCCVVLTSVRRTQRRQARRWNTNRPTSNARPLLLVRVRPCVACVRVTRVCAAIVVRQKEREAAMAAERQRDIEEVKLLQPQ
jgi:hypothetical protein